MQNRKPMVLVLAGPNGSGKSTITTFFEKVGKYTNADDIVASTGMDNMEAAILADKMRYESIEKKEDFSFETVLSSDYKLEILRNWYWFEPFPQAASVLDWLVVYNVLYLNL